MRFAFAAVLWKLSIGFQSWSKNQIHHSSSEHKKAKQGKNDTGSYGSSSKTFLSIRRILRTGKIIFGYIAGVEEWLR